jgi:hypothetical protein
MMTFQLTLVQKSDYLHAVVTGQNTKENVASYLAEVLRECRSRGCSKVLIEERLEGARLGTSDIFAIVSKGSAQALGVMKAIAYVDVNAEGELMRFAETVAVNRALPVAVFPTVAEAEDWLQAASAD